MLWGDREDNAQARSADDRRFRFRRARVTRATAGKIALFLLLAAGVASFFFFDLNRFLTLDSLKARHDSLIAFVEARPLTTATAFFVAYVTATALSVPGAAILTLAAGALFGLWIGTAIVSFASAIGASLAFLSSRYLLRDWVKARFAKRVAAIDQGIAKDGAFYLLSLRLIPLFPFFLINLAMGLTNIRLLIYYVVSQIGMLPGTIVFVLAGTQLAAVRGAGDVLSPGLIGSFVLLGIFPLLAKAWLGVLARRRVYKGFARPRRFDRNLVVIGAGAGGLVTAFIGATVRASVTLVEKDKMGGDCLNYGCVPSKALIRSARLAHDIRLAGCFGLKPTEPQVDFRAVMARVDEVIATIAPADSVERYEAMGVDVRRGHARIVNPWTVAITDEAGATTHLTTRAIVIAAGGAPFVPDIPGLNEAGFLTSDTMWDALAGRESVPARMVIVGGGPIGSEMAQAFARLGAKVTLVEAGDCLLANEDEEVSRFIAGVLGEEGVDVRTGHEAVRCDGKLLVARSGKGETSFAFDEIIIAVGRAARLSGYGLEELGIDTGKTVAVDAWLRTKFPNIYAVGDVAGPYQFTHLAAHQAWYAAVNALFGSFRRFRADYRVVPWTTFTDPEVAHVGHSEASAAAAEVPFEVVRYDLSHLDRAVAEGTNRGFVKLLVAPGKDRILGATIVAAHAGEMIAELVLAMKNGLGLNAILGTIHAYPTMAEANKYAAGEWKKAHKSETALRWLERYHRWRRR